MYVDRNTYMKHGIADKLEYHRDGGGQMPAYPTCLPWNNQEDVAACEDNYT